MANSFGRAGHSLRADNGRLSIVGIGVAALVLSGWLLWAFKSHVTRYEVSDSARLEIAGAAYPVQANVSGRVVVSHLVLGRDVQAGDVLAELDSEDQKLTLQEERTRLNSYGPQLAALRSQMQFQDQGRTDERRVLGLSIEGARAQYQQAETQAKLAEQEAERAGRLRSEGILALADLQKAKAEAQSKRAAAESLKVAISRLEPELQVREKDRDVKLNQTLGDETKIEAEMATAAATVKRLEYEIERRTIRATISGRLGECAALHAGSHVSEGQQLGMILPHGQLQVIAEFQPSAALGKVQPGQSAVLRLSGFPWAQYGTVQASVHRVASEIRDGKVRVELAVNAPSRSRIPFQHGLPGTVEVQVEQVSPATLVLRSAGALIGAH